MKSASKGCRSRRHGRWWAWVALTVPAVAFLMPPGCGVNAVPVAGIEAVAGFSFQFIRPARDEDVAQGQVFRIQWAATDPVGDAVVTLELDEDRIAGNGNERTVAVNIALLQQFFDLDTTNLPEGSFFVRAIITGTAAPGFTRIADGRLRIVPAGTQPSNSPPEVRLIRPETNLSVTQSDIVEIEWEASDADDSIVVVFTLDTDRNATNDDPFAPDRITSFPIDSRTVELVEDTGQPEDQQDTGEPPPPNIIEFEIDLTRIPPQPGGAPYFIKATAWDRVNPPVHTYAPGAITVTRLAESRLLDANTVEPVDLGKVGLEISGATWLGFNAGANLGTTLRTARDFDDDGIDDVVLVAQFGVPQQVKFKQDKHRGEAYLLYGKDGVRYGGRNQVNTISVDPFLPGLIFTGPIFDPNPTQLSRSAPPRDLTPRMGITDFTAIDHWGFADNRTDDDRPELVFGMAHNPGIGSTRDDDPGDDPPSQVELPWGGGIFPITRENEQEFLPESLPGDWFDTWVAACTGPFDTADPPDDCGSVHDSDTVLFAGLQQEGGPLEATAIALLRFEMPIADLPTKNAILRAADVTASLTLQVLGFGTDRDNPIQGGEEGIGSDLWVQPLLCVTEEEGGGCLSRGIVCDGEDVEACLAAADVLLGPALPESETSASVGEVQFDVTSNAIGVLVDYALDETQSKVIFEYAIVDRPPRDPDLPDDDTQNAIVQFASGNDPRPGFRPRLTLQFSFGAERGVVGCYSDGLANNRATQDPDNDPLGVVEDTDVEIQWGEWLGNVVIFYSNLPQSQQEQQVGEEFRLANQTFALDEVGQAPRVPNFRVDGARFNMAIYEQPQIDAFDQNQEAIGGLFGQTVEAIGDIDGDGRGELVVSAPHNDADVRDTVLRVRCREVEIGMPPGTLRCPTHVTTRLTARQEQVARGTGVPGCRSFQLGPGGELIELEVRASGNVIILLSDDYNDLRLDQNASFPYLDGASCQVGPDIDSTRDLRPLGADGRRGGLVAIVGEDPDDELGGARNAGDFNQDGLPDIVMGAPRADGPVEFDGPVRALTLFDDGSGLALYAGGEFTQIDDQVVNFVARWNGDGWSPLGDGLTGTVFALASFGGQLYAGGTFGIARWDGQSWNSVGGGVNGTVYAMAVFASRLYVGGDFTTAGGVGAANIASWDGTIWQALGAGTNDTVFALAEFDEDGSGPDPPLLFVGGAFTQVDNGPANHIATWDGANWASMALEPDGTVLALAVFKDALYVGGEFTRIQNAAASYFARWTGVNWDGDSDGLGVDAPVRALATYDPCVTMPEFTYASDAAESIYVGGDFTDVLVNQSDLEFSHVARFDGTSWTNVGTGITGETVYALASGNVTGTPTLFVGGDFTTEIDTGHTVSHIVRWTGLHYSFVGSGDRGTAYILYSRPWRRQSDFLRLSELNSLTGIIPALRIFGLNPGDQLGYVQAGVGRPDRGIPDFDQDLVGDVLIASPFIDVTSDIDPQLGADEVIEDAGAVGLIFGGFDTTGDRRFDQIGTQALPGLIFVGTQPGGLAGTSVSQAGDFNGDGFGDILIAAPGEVRELNGQLRKGVVYLIFGRQRADVFDPANPANNVYRLDLVGTNSLPGIVFVSPFEAGTIDEAAPSAVGFLGDLNNDGFDDIGIGNPLADFVDPGNPGDRREDAGEAYFVYGSNFGRNNPTLWQ